MSSKTNPQHYYMVAAVLTYVRKEVSQGGVPVTGVPKQRNMNIVLELPRKAITHFVINNARQAMLQRLAEESSVISEEVRDIVFLNFSYLGLMKPEDFYDTPPATSIPN